jgi:hypothetical protein
MNDICLAAADKKYCVTPDLENVLEVSQKYFVTMRKKACMKDMNLIEKCCKMSIIVYMKVIDLSNEIPKNTLSPGLVKILVGRPKNIFSL